MATRTILVDDIDPTKEAVETVRWSLDGVEYEIDLSAENASRLRVDVDLYIQSSRVCKKPKNKSGSPDWAARKAELAPVRAWAKRKRIKVSPGRIHPDVIARYNSETGSNVRA